MYAVDAGMAQFVSHFAEPGDPEYAPPVPKCETRVRFSLSAECPAIYMWSSCNSVCIISLVQTLWSGYWGNLIVLYCNWFLVMLKPYHESKVLGFYAYYIVKIFLTFIFGVRLSFFPLRKPIWMILPKIHQIDIEVIIEMFMDSLTTCLSLYSFQNWG